jgi:hypothetical protein
MKVVTYEGVVENGRVQLPAGVLLPEKATVYVVVPAVSAETVAYIASPRLVHPEQAKDFITEVLPERTDAGL